MGVFRMSTIAAGGEGAVDTGASTAIAWFQLVGDRSMGALDKGVNTFAG